MDAIYHHILENLYKTRGIDFSGYRNSFVIKQIEKRIADLGMNDPNTYRFFLENTISEYDHLIDTILINVSCFFRDPIVFEIISQDILQNILERNSYLGSKEIRIWSAGCANGEEAYSLAILIAEVLKNEDNKWEPYIFATDISNDALQKAEMGMYSRDKLEHIKLGFLDKYFDSTATGFKISQKIKEMVIFSNDNLVSYETFAPKDSIFGEFDLILCRNVMIYFSLVLQERILTKLYKAIKHKGYLVLGNCESLSSSMKNQLMSVNSKHRIYQK